MPPTTLTNINMQDLIRILILSSITYKFDYASPPLSLTSPINKLRPTDPTPNMTTTLTSILDHLPPPLHLASPRSDIGFLYLVYKLAQRYGHIARRPINGAGANGGLWFPLGCEVEDILSHRHEEAEREAALAIDQEIAYINGGEKQ